MKKQCKICGKVAEMLSWEDECYVCKKKQHVKDVLQDIQEGRDTSCEDEIYCPWCGVILACDADTPEAYEDGTHVIDCPECGREFALETSVSFSYSTSRKLPGWILRDRERRGAV